MGEDIDADFVSTTFAAAAGYSSMIAGARPGTILNLFERLTLAILLVGAKARSRRTASNR